MLKNPLDEYLNTVFLEPAYGRKYASEDLALKDWHGGKDFKFVGGPYCSVRDRDVIKKTMRDPQVYIKINKDTFVKV